MIIKQESGETQSVLSSGGSIKTTFVNENGTRVGTQNINSKYQIQTITTHGRTHTDIRTQQVKNEREFYHQKHKTKQRKTGRQDHSHKVSHVQKQRSQ
jgi:hypothetical protein